MVEQAAPPRAGAAAPARTPLRLVEIEADEAGRIPTGVGELDRVLVRNPNHVDGLDRLASLAAGEGNWRAAAEAYGRALQVVERGTRLDPVARLAVATADALPLDSIPETWACHSATISRQRCFRD